MPTFWNIQRETALKDRMQNCTGYMRVTVNHTDQIRLCPVLLTAAFSSRPSRMCLPLVSFGCSSLALKRRWNPQSPSTLRFFLDSVEQLLILRPRLQRSMMTFLQPVCSHMACKAQPDAWHYFNRPNVPPNAGLRGQRGLLERAGVESAGHLHAGSERSSCTVLLEHAGFG
jgi:hypothetical protein